MTETKQKAKSKGFADLGVPVGAVLAFRKDPTITATVVDEKNKVEYQGKVYPISGLAKELMKTAISGYQAFKYNGVLLAKLGESNAGQPVEKIPAPAPAEEIPVVGLFPGGGSALLDPLLQAAKTAPVAPKAPEPVKPQTIPLPMPHGAPVAPTSAIPNIDPLANQPADE